MNIAFDLDGTLVDSWARKVYLDQIVYGHETCSYEEFWGGIFESYPESKKMFFRKTPIYYSSNPIRSKIKAMLKDIAKHHTIFYITCRPEEVYYTTKRYLEENDVPCQDNLFFSTTKKVIEVRALDIDWLVDDDPTYLDATKEFCQGVLVEAYWNRDKRQGFITIPSILDIKNILELENEIC